MSTEKIAFLFPGQGTLPDRLPDTSPLTRSLVEKADQKGLRLAEWIDAGDTAQLTRTAAAQPALFIDSLSCEATLRAKGFVPSLVAGHSLGEYPALVSAGVLEPVAAFDIVLERGRLMDGIDGGMLAIVKLPIDRVEALCKEAGNDVTVANLNSPAQAVISGKHESLERLAALAKSEGGRAIPLKVSGPFHSPFMKPAEDALASSIRAAAFSDPTVPIVSAVTGRVLQSADDIRAIMLQQITSPVRWIDVIATLESQEITLAIEVGRGKTLSGLGPRITKSIRFATYEEALHG